LSIPNVSSKPTTFLIWLCEAFDDKRFSLPAVGLHTTVVTTRTSIESEEGVVVEERVNNGLSKRFPLVSVGRNSHQVDATGSGSGQHDHTDGQDDLGLAKVYFDSLAQVDRTG